jgi:hypothetical protein
MVVTLIGMANVLGLGLVVYVFHLTARAERK